MKFFWALRVVLALGLAAALFGEGCFPESNHDGDEQNEPYFLKGKSLENAMDYDGAIQAFEKALEVNPRSASAHLKLGVLCMQRGDYPAALYHFEKHLTLAPNSPLASIVKQRMMACKIEIAKTVAFYLDTPQVQKEFDRLTAENRGLRERNELLQRQLQELIRSNQLAKASANLANVPDLSGRKSNETASAATGVAAARGHPNRSTQPASASPTQAALEEALHYTVRRGDTFFKIARNFGVRVSDLRAANPGVRPERLRANQVLRIPARKS